MARRRKKHTANEQRSGETNLKAFEDFFYSAVRAGGSTAGQSVTATTAQRVSAVYACTTAVCESVAMLPATLLNEENERKKTKATDHPLFDLLRYAPNEFMDSFEFFEVMQGQLLDTGNAYAFQERTNSGELISLLPLQPQHVKMRMQYDQRTGKNVLSYEHRPPNGGTEIYTPEEILHVKYRSQDGYSGRTPIQVAAESYGFSLAILEHANKVFENGAFLSGMLETDQMFKDDEQRRAFMESFKAYMGVSNSGKFALLEHGVKYKPHQMNARDAQLCELMDLSALNIARIYRIPPVMIQMMNEGMSYASIEQLGIFFVQYTIQPWVTRWERAIKRQLLNRPGEESLFVKFNVMSLIRGDLQSVTNSIVQQLQYGLRSINEGRHLLDQNAVTDPLADEVMVSHNMIPLSQVGTADAQANQEPDNAGQDDDETDTDTETQADTENDAQGANTAVGDLERFRPLLRSLLGRLRRKEQKALRGAARKGGVLHWAEEFLARHMEDVRETLAPALQAIYGLDLVADDFLSVYRNRRESELLTAEGGATAFDLDDCDELIAIIFDNVRGET